MLLFVDIINVVIIIGVSVVVIAINITISEHSRSHHPKRCHVQSGYWSSELDVVV